MPKYTVLSRVEHDGKPYEVNAEIDLDEARAKPLLDGGAIKPTEVKPVDPPNSDVPPSPGASADTTASAPSAISKVPGPKNPPRHPTDKERG